MFKNVQTKIIAQFANMTATGHLFSVEVDREKIWKTYLDSFDEDLRQGNNCNCCKSFLRQYAGIVAINDKYELMTLWDIEVDDPEYINAIKNLRRYVKSLTIKNAYFNSRKNKHHGTKQNFDLKRSVHWDHFYVELPDEFIKTRHSELIAAKLADHNVFKRSIEEISDNAVDSVLELIGQNSLYKGREFKTQVEGLRKAKLKYKKLNKHEKKNFFWLESAKANGAICRIRNSAIGTLLNDLSDGRDLDHAVTAYEKVVAPANYKRPTALVTPRMIKDAQKRVGELGLTGALKRRLFEETDLNINNAIYIESPPEEELDVFDSLVKETPLDPKKFSKVEEIGIQDFLDNVVPTAKSIRAFVANKHLGNFVALVAPESEEGSLFKWDNNFSWSYSGEIADSMREQVVKLGGRVDGALRFTHSWNHPEAGRNNSLMDLHVFMPGSSSHTTGCHDKYPTGQRVGWNKRRDAISGGSQDVDYVQPAPANKIPIENISFPNIKKLKEGKYTFKIHNWEARNLNKSGFQAEIEFQGQIYSYSHPRPLKHKEWVTLAEVTLKDGVFTIDHKMKSQEASKEKWGLNTNQLHTVKAITLSPNHWGKGVGNKHFFFMLEGCSPDEKIRPFYNEFLKGELSKDRKVFEILGGKIKVENHENSLAGIGFADTVRNSLIVEVEGATKRTLKIKF